MNLVEFFAKYRSIHTVAICTTNNFFRGVPGIDWRVDAAKTSDLSRLYYNIYDSNHPNGVGLLLQCVCVCMCMCVCVCVCVYVCACVWPDLRKSASMNTTARHTFHYQRIAVHIN